MFWVTLKNKKKVKMSQRSILLHRNTNIDDTFHAVVYRTVSIAPSPQMSSAAAYGRSSGEYCRLSMHGRTAFIFFKSPPPPLSSGLKEPYSNMIDSVV